MVEWRSVVGWEGYYEVSDRGQVRNSLTGKLLRQSLMYVNGRKYPERAYYSVRLSGPRRAQPYVHRLVLKAFAGPCPVGKGSLPSTW